MIDETANLKSLHDAYVAISGQELQWNTHTMYTWKAFSVDYDIEDLRLVLRTINQGIRAGERNRRAAAFKRLIQDPIMFASELADAKAVQRSKERVARKPPAKFTGDKGSVLRSTAHFTDDAPRLGERTAGKVLEQFVEPGSMTAYLRKWKEENL